jgi:heme/copper-type cytochrome/quinol oxidase subunit 4
VTSNGETRRAARALLATWLFLIALTIGSFAWAGVGAAADSGTAAWVLGLAAVKAHLIAGTFMEMRRGPRAPAVVMSGFLLAEAAVIVALFG